MDEQQNRASRIRTVGRWAVVVIAVAGTVAAGGTAAYATPAQPSPAKTTAGCRPIKGGAAGYVDEGRGTARRYTFDSDGTHITSIVPPAGWNPLTATDQELRTYGLRPRPTDAAGLAAWRAHYAHYKGTVTPSFCTGSRTHALTSTNWSGIIGTRNGYTQADSEWTEPSFVAVCPSQSSYSMWPGIGGYYSPGGKFKLIQAGTDTGTSGPSDVYTWVELISTDHPFPEMETNAPVSPGDTISVGVAWDAANKGVAFEFYNITQGWDGTGEITAVNGVAASQFYDGGSSAEVISERASQGNTPLRLRKPSSGYAQYYGADFNGSPVVNDSSLTTITMATTHNLSTVDNMYVGVGSNTTYWQTTWHACS
jgi:hypothetical protein